MTSSLGLFVLLVRDESGKLHSTMGVEVQPARFAPSGELIREQHCTDYDMALRLESLFILLGCEVPCVPSLVQLLCVNHHGFDDGEIFSPEPRDAKAPYWQAVKGGRVVFVHGESNRG